MKLSELKTLLREGADKHFRLRLPNGSPVPVSFHVTEVGKVQKTFIDCGGTLRESVACQLQVWVGKDFDHRIESQKAAAILEKAKSFFPDEEIPVEVEYEDEVISQYTIEGFENGASSVVLKLGHKHTQCLAMERCGVPGGSEANGERCCASAGCS